MRSLTIGQVAERAGVGVETVRFYEREGLIAEPPRRPSGYRDYPGEVVERIGFIRRARELGFSLKEVRELLELQASPPADREAARRSAVDKIADIEQRIESLERMRSSLRELTHDGGARTELRYPSSRPPEAPVSAGLVGECDNS